MKTDLYPILFKPLCRYRDWGSSLLRNVFEIPEAGEPPAELFQMIDSQLGSSVVQNGALEGKTLHDLAQMGPDIMGRRRFSDYFPICVKFFATGKPLALQVHPSDNAVRQNKKLRPNAKAWYVIQTEGKVEAHAELKPQYTQQQLLSRIGNENLYDVIYTLELSEGDCCYLPSGRVHGIDKGCLMLSVEQNEPTTFQLSDAGSMEFADAITLTDPEVAKQVINFKDRSIPRNVSDGTKEESRNRKISLVNTNPAFSLEELRLVSKMHHRAGGDSYHILIPIDVPIDVTWGKESLKVGPLQACLIPAKIGFYSTVPHGPGKLIRVS